MHSSFAVAFSLRIIAQTCIFVSEILMNKNKGPALWIEMVLSSGETEVT